jgi:hypothetical protein
MIIDDCHLIIRKIISFQNTPYVIIKDTQFKLGGLLMEWESTNGLWFLTSTTFLNM